MTVKINLDEDTLRVLSHLNFGKIPDLTKEKGTMTWGLDFYSLYGGNFLLEDLAYILNKFDDVIPDTMESAMGPRFKRETEDYMLGIHYYIVDNIEYIESLIHYYCDKGGLKPGTYKCKSYEKIWERVD